MAFFAAIVTALCMMAAPLTTDSGHTTIPTAARPLARVVPVERDARLSNAFQAYALKDWVGRQFLFFPLAKNLQGFGYRSFILHLEAGKGQQQYDSLVGRTGTVTDVSAATRPMVTMRMSNGATVSAMAILGMVDGIVLTADIDSAKARYVGKTLWINKEFLFRLNDNGEKDPVILDRGTPVKVADIGPGVDRDRPIRFSLRMKTGQIAFIDVHVSNTNLPEAMRKYGTVRNAFLEVDPAVVAKWPQTVLDAIKAGRVEVGMSVEQVRMAWGEADEAYSVKGRPGAQLWVYGSTRSLVIERNSVTEVAG